jgi:hypothetical protein
MIWQTIGRLILIPIAALLAIAATLFVLVTLGLERLTHATQGQSLDPDTLGTAFDWIATGLQWASGLTLVPALAVIVIGEVARIRSWLYYVLGGGAAVACIPLLTAMNGSVGGAIALPAVWQVLATAGFAGGFVYWLIAGRNS